MDSKQKIENIPNPTENILTINFDENEIQEETKEEA